MNINSPNNIYSNLFSDQAKEVAKLASEIAKKHNHKVIDVEHVFLALLEQDNSTIKHILENIGVDLISIHDKTKRNLPRYISFKFSNQIYISKRVKTLIDLAAKEALILSDKELLPEHIFLAMFEDEDKSKSPITRILSQYNIKKSDVYQQIKKLAPPNDL